MPVIAYNADQVVKKVKKKVEVQKDRSQCRVDERMPTWLCWSETESLLQLPNERETLVCVPLLSPP